MSRQNKKLIVTIFFLAGLGFVLGPVFGSTAEELVVSEIMYDPEGSDAGHSDWIEIHNPSSHEIRIPRESFGIIDEAELKLGKDGKHHLNCHAVSQDLAIGPQEFLIVAADAAAFEADHPDFEGQVIDSAFSLSSGGDTIRLSADGCATFFISLAFSAGWGGSDNGRTLESIKNDGSYGQSSWQESYLIGGTPGKKSSTRSLAKKYPDGPRINEVFPNPEGDEEQGEFIEIYNASEENVELGGWRIRDASSAKGFVFPDPTDIGPGEYRTIFRTGFKFALNNSGKENVVLADPNGRVVSRVDFEKAKEGLAYGADGRRWRWSLFPTPDGENVFGDDPDYSVRIARPVYRNTEARFSVSMKNYRKGTTKITWRFGDGHKSYKKETTHKYKKTGKYYGSVKISNGNEEVTRNFTVEVKNFSEPEVEIIEVVPNPVGKDAELETISVRNSSGKKINLQGWSLAIGDEKMVNHPIRTKLMIKAEGTVRITRADSRFTLHNQKGKVELRYPDGKVASRMRYEKIGGSLDDGDILEKTGRGWALRKTAATGGSRIGPSDGGTPGSETGKKSAGGSSGEQWGGQSKRMAAEGSPERFSLEQPILFSDWKKL